MSRVKKTGARTRSDVSNRALARAVDAAVDRLEGRLDALSMRMDAVERREADRTFVKPEPAPIPPLEIGAVQAKSQVTEGGTYHRVTIRGDGLSEAKVGPIDADAVARVEKESRARDAEKLEVGGANAIRGAEVDRLLEETQPWYESGPGLYPDRRVPIEPGSIERLIRFLVERSASPR